MTQETGILFDLNLKPGHVVECVGWADCATETFRVGCRYTIMERHPRGIYEGLCAVRDGGWVEVDRPDSKMLFRVISRASEPDTRKPLRDMTDAEIGALVRQCVNGKTLQYYNPVHDVWSDKHLGLEATEVVRVRPEPKRETVTLYCDGVNAGRDPLVIGTIDLSDGKPDRDSIKMKEVE